MKNKTLSLVLGRLSRTLLALVFLFSGFVKMVDPAGTVYKIEDYLKAFGGFFTDLLPLAPVAAVLLIAAEFTLGVLLLFNVWTRVTSWLSLAFYAVMLPLTLYIAIKNPVTDCGCFGDALVISNWATFYKNLVLMALVIMLLCCRRQLPTTFVWQVELVICLLGVGLSCGWMAYTYYHLPVMDFRPYKIGNDIPALMEIPEGAEMDEYKVTFIYERDGVQQEFDITNYPKGDSTWHFVDQKSVLVKKGYEAPIHDFEIINADYEDITYDILESETPVTLVVMYDMEKTDLSQLDRVHALREQCMANGEDFYILTGSGEAVVEAFPWEEKECICTCDPVTLKTIVRANPGVFVVQQGLIIDKYNIRNR